MSTETGPNIDYAGASTFNDFPRYAQQQMLADEDQRRNIRYNASLPNEAWIGIDQTVFPAFDDVLTVVSDLQAAGLTTPESVFNKATEWNMRDYSSQATISMDPDTQTDENAHEYDLDGAPQPVIHADFSVGWRDSGSEGDHPRGMGDEMPETLGADAAARAVAEALEYMVLHGWEPTISGAGAKADGYSMYGLTNHPQNHGGTLADWTTAPGEIRGDLQAMARDLKDDDVRPQGVGYNVYIGEDLEDPLAQPDPDFDDSFVRDTVQQAVPNINTIQVSEYLEPDAVLMFRPTPDVVDLAVSLEEQVVQWEEPFRDHFKVITGMTPRVKQTLRGQHGIAYYTGGTS